MYSRRVLFTIDQSSGENLADQLAGQIRTAIARGDLESGARLPSARDLAESLGINIHTVLRAFQDVRDEGLVDLRRGRGAVVTEAANDIRELRDAIHQAAAVSRTLDVRPATAIAMLKEALK